MKVCIIWLLIVLIAIALSIWLTITIVNSDLPLWLKFLLLR